MRPIYLQLFRLELLLETCAYSTLSYIKDSATERALQIGKLRLLISTHPAPKANMLVVEFL